MRRGNILSAIAATTTLLVLGLAISPAAHAQGRGGRGGRGAYGGQGGGQGGPGAQFGFGNGPTGALQDPTRSAESYLLTRDDVRHELLLDGRQQQDIDEQIKKNQQDSRTKIMAAMQDVRQKTQANGQNPRDMTPEERQAAMQQRQQQIQDAINPILADEDKALEALLNPTQVKRLHQLDLQWRTALALNAPTLADQVALTPDQRPQVTALYQEYQTEQRSIMMGVFGGRRANGRRGNGGNGQGNNGSTQDNSGNQNGTGGNAGGDQNANAQGNNADPNAAPPPPANDPQSVQERLQQAQKEIAKLRKTSSDKVLALLSPEQKAQWTKMTGRAFVFKTDQPNTGTANGN
jgi:hypothetical protein